MAIEEIGRALARLDDGEYGTCLGCGGPISFEHLEAIPQARRCATCAAAAASFADRSPGLCLASDRGERPPPLERSLRHRRSTAHTSESRRGNPIVR